jgi:hypothetical protein
MKRWHKTEDGDGVDRGESPEVHENVRESTEGVEERAARGRGGRGSEAAAGLIGGGASGKGEMVDPRYIAPR